MTATASRSESRQLRALVGVRMTPDEFAQGCELARATGVSLPALLRQLLTYELRIEAVS